MDGIKKTKEKMLVIYPNLDSSDNGQNNYLIKNSLKRYELKHFYPCYDSDNEMNITDVYNKLRQEICDFSPSELLMYVDIETQVVSRAFVKVIEKLLAEFSHIKVHYQQKQHSLDDLNNLNFSETPAFI